MFPAINIDPEPAQLDAVRGRYKEQEPNYPKAVASAANRWATIAVVLVFVLNAVPALILAILRLPFILIRKIRVFILGRQSIIRFNRNSKDDPDHWREHHFEPPVYKLTNFEKKREQATDDLGKDIAKLKEQWQQAPEAANLNVLLDYTIHLSVQRGVLGNEVALFILDQINDLPEQQSMKYELLYQNLFFATDNLQLPNNSAHFKKLAEAHGYKPKYRNSKLGWIALILESGRYLHRDIINCWPK
jgi:hypothetical protein